MVAAAELFTDQGLAPTTVDQIAERADVSQTTFFNYFPTKTGLVDALTADLVVMFDGIVERARGTETPALHAIRNLFEAGADLTEVQHRLLRDLIAETVRTSTAEARDSFEHMRSVFTRCVAEGQERGELRDDRSATRLAEAVLGLYISAFLFWTTDADYPIADRLRESVESAVELVERRP